MTVYVALLSGEGETVEEALNNLQLNIANAPYIIAFVPPTDMREMAVVRHTEIKHLGRYDSTVDYSKTQWDALHQVAKQRWEE
jgi:hypothetical protein